MSAGAGSVVCNFFAVMYLDLAVANALMYTMPAWAALVASTAGVAPRYLERTSTDSADFCTRRLLSTFPRRASRNDSLSRDSM